VAGVGDVVERLGGVLAGAAHGEVVDHDRVAASTRVRVLAGCRRPLAGCRRPWPGAVDPGPADLLLSDSRGDPATRRFCTIAAFERLAGMAIPIRRWLRSAPTA
jgi:hypothetical protein